MGGAIGAVRLSSPQQHHVVVAVGGSQHACGWRSMLRACAQCQGLWARSVVWGDALGAVRSPTRSSWCSVVAFGGSLPGHSTQSALRASVQCEGFPWMQGVSRGGHVPHERGGGWRTFTPLRWCWTIGRVTVVCLSTTLGPWDLLVTWPGVPWVSSSALGVVARRRCDSVVVVCTGCEGRVARLCATPWVWLCQRDGSGGGAHSLALVVVGGACPWVQRDLSIV